MTTIELKIRVDELTDAPRSHDKGNWHAVYESKGGDPEWVRGYCSGYGKSPTGAVEDLANRLEIRREMYYEERRAEAILRSPISSSTVPLVVEA